MVLTPVASSASGGTIYQDSSSGRQEVRNTPPSQAIREGPIASGGGSRRRRNEERLAVASSVTGGTIYQDSEGNQEVVPVQTGNTIRSSRSTYSSRGTTRTEESLNASLPENLRNKSVIEVKQQLNIPLNRRENLSVNYEEFKRRASTITPSTPAEAAVYYSRKVGEIVAGSAPDYRKQAVSLPGDTVIQIKETRFFPRGTSSYNSDKGYYLEAKAPTQQTIISRELNVRKDILGRAAQGISLGALSTVTSPSFAYTGFKQIRDANTLRPTEVSESEESKLFRRRQYAQGALNVAVLAIPIGLKAVNTVRSPVFRTVGTPVTQRVFSGEIQQAERGSIGLISSVDTTSGLSIVQTTKAREIFGLQPKKVTAVSPTISASSQAVRSTDDLSVSYVGTQRYGPSTKLKTFNEIKAVDRSVPIEEFGTIAQPYRYASKPMQPLVYKEGEAITLSLGEAQIQKGIQVNSEGFRLMRSSSTGSEYFKPNIPAIESQVTKAYSFALVKEVPSKVPEVQSYQVLGTTKFTNSNFPRATGNILPAKGIINVRQVADKVESYSLGVGRGTITKQQTEQVVRQAAQQAQSIPLPKSLPKIYTAKASKIVSSLEDSYSSAPLIVGGLGKSKSQYAGQFVKGRSAYYGSNVIQIEDAPQIIKVPSARSTFVVSNAQLGSQGTAFTSAERTAQPSLQIEAVKEALRPKLGAPSRNAVKVAEILAAREDVLLGSPQAQSSATALKILTRQRFRTPVSPQLKVPKPIVPTTPFKLKSKTKSNPKIIFRGVSSSQAYDVISFRKGKPFTVAKGLPKGKATKAGADFISKNLRASFKLQAAGSTTAEDISYRVNPTVFRPGKRDASRIVQRSKFRLSSGTERSEIQSSKRRKAKGFSFF